MTDSTATYTRICIQKLLGLQFKKGEIVGGHVASLGKKKNAYRVWWGNLKEIDHLEDLGIDGRML
jgi:hypothetical protein